MSISNELLSVILNREVKNNLNTVKDLVVFAYVGEDTWRDIEIYEVIYLCKKWLVSKDYFITIKYDPRIGRSKVQLSISKDNTTIFGEEHFYADSEEDVIFQACEWVLKQ